MRTYSTSARSPFQPRRASYTSLNVRLGNCDDLYRSSGSGLTLFGNWLRYVRSSGLLTSALHTLHIYYI